MGVKFFGARVHRAEDPALLRGQGQFVDDIHLPGAVHAAFLRSPHAHARVRSLRTEKALSAPGVCAVYTLSDFPARLREQPLPLMIPSPFIREPRTQHVLSRDEVCYVGEAIAVVIADSRYAAEDGVGLLEVDYEPLAAAADCLAGCAPNAPLAHHDGSDNIAARFTLAVGDADAAFGVAFRTFRESLRQHRGCGHAMECRAVLAFHDAVQDLLTVWSATQVPHIVKRALVDVLGLDENQVRVIAPDVGGGFGPKGVFYPEEAAISVCAMLLKRPVKWTEDRREHFISATQERDQHWDVEIAVDRQGKILGVRGGMIHDAGAYLPWGIITPHISATTMPGPYLLPNFRLDVTVVFTNKTPTTPVRGGGRPQAVFAMERLMDRVAREFGLSPAEVRRRNFIRPEQMPYDVGLIYRDGNPLVYDSGDYPACQARALELADYDNFPIRQAEAWQQGRYLGIGLANHVEGSGYGPFEGATVRVTSAGKVRIYTGAAPHGQGHKTTLAQICADQLGVDIRDITVVTGDTAGIPLGTGTYASRTAVNSGSAVHLAAKQVREKIIKSAAHLLEAAENDIHLESGRVFVKGAPFRELSFSELAHIVVVGKPGFSMPSGVEPGLEASRYFSPRQATFCNGSHVVEVEADIATGVVRILRYTAVHDSGRLINPTVVDGQVQGGVAHGIGNALYEWMRYDENAQPLTTSFADYLLPLATDVPTVAIEHLETPTPLNPLGVKGAGEGGTIPAVTAIVAAVENALEPFKVHLTEAPIVPQRIVELLEAAGAGTEVPGKT